jgi:hypothetical protein
MGTISEEGKAMKVVGYFYLKLRSSRMKYFLVK